MTRVLYSLCGADAKRPFSPHAWKIVMALHHKGLDFEERPTPFTEIPNIENGATKTVPLLIDGNQKVTDSFAIAAYLDEKGLDSKDLIIEEYLGDFREDDENIDVDIYVFLK